MYYLFLYTLFPRIILIRETLKIRLIFCNFIISKILITVQYRWVCNEKVIPGQISLERKDMVYTTPVLTTEHNHYFLVLNGGLWTLSPNLFISTECRRQSEKLQVWRRLVGKKKEQMYIRNYTFFFLSFWATPTAYRGSQVRDLIRAVATGLCYSHSEMEF